MVRCTISHLSCSSHPEIKVVANGYADNRSASDYNNVLSYNRANEAINYLVSNYNIPRNRFILKLWW